MTNGNTRNCPPTEALAMFLDGMSSASELSTMIEHLQGCARCRSIVETASEEELIAAKSTGRKSWWLAAAAAAMISVAFVPLWRSQSKPDPAPDPVQRLVAATPKSGRAVEGRLSGFRHAPFVAERGEAKPELYSTERLEFGGVAGRTIRELQTVHSVEALHATALAHLLTGHEDAAISELDRAAGLRRDDPKLWNDLATARLARAAGKPAYLSPALDAANRAIKLSPRMAEAHFNRALILERLGVRNDARAAWDQYLKIDSASDWANEARDHLRRLGPRVDLKEERNRAFAALDKGDSTLVEALIERDPQMPRRYCEGFLTTQWAQAERDKDAARATKILQQLMFVASLLSSRGEHLLEDALAAIAASERDPRARAALIDGYIAYDEGSRHLNDRPAQAEPLLRRAAALFASGGSPMADDAQYFLATAIFEQTRVPEARSILAELLDRIDRKRHPALAAQIQWELGRCDCYAGAWSECMDRLEDSRTLFEQHREKANAAFIVGIMAEVDDRTARVEEGWRRRIAAFDGLSSGSDYRTPRILNGAIRAEVFRRQYDSALGLVALAIDWNRADNDSELLTETLIRRTSVLRDAGRVSDARESLAEARETAGTIENDESRRLRTNEINVLEASLIRASAPDAAIALLDPAIAFYRERHHAIWLPTAYLERGRAYRAAGDSAKALADFEAGLAEVEQQRSTIEDDRRREGFFDTIPDLFAEAIVLRLDNDDVEGAHRTAERARARTLYEHLGLNHAAVRATTLEQLRAALDPETVVIAYSLLPDTVAIFAVDRDSVHVTRRAVSTERLRDLASGLVTSIQNNRHADARSAGKALWQILVEPVIREIDGRSRIVLVPDRFLYSITYPALFDPRTDEFLVERHEIVIAPSATLAAVERQPKVVTSRALVIGDPASAEDVIRLPYAASEAKAVASAYGVDPLIGSRATRSQILARAPTSTLIHYAGHARESSDDSDGQLLLAGSGGEGALGAMEIARLSLPNTLLVSLAACSTFRGSADRIEGMSSVARAFIAAGVPWVVGTLWDVPDQNMADLFIDFHRHIGRGASPAAALREAQIAQLRRAGNRSLSWATVTVMGARTRSIAGGPQ